MIIQGVCVSPLIGWVSLSTNEPWSRTPAWGEAWASTKLFSKHFFACCSQELAASCWQSSMETFVWNLKQRMVQSEPPWELQPAENKALSFRNPWEKVYDIATAFSPSFLLISCSNSLCYLRICLMHSFVLCNHLVSIVHDQRNLINT